MLSILPSLLGKEVSELVAKKVSGPWSSPDHPGSLAQKRELLDPRGQH